MVSKVPGTNVRHSRPASNTGRAIHTDWGAGGRTDGRGTGGAANYLGESFVGNSLWVCVRSARTRSVV